MQRRITGTAIYWVSSLGRPEEALVLHRKALALDPFSVGIMNSIANDLEYLGRFDEALAGYEKSLEVDPNFAESYHSIGRLLLVRFRTTRRCRGLVRKGIALDLGNPQYPANLGLLFLDLGDPSKAEYWINRSIKLGPENSFPILRCNFFICTGVMKPPPWTMHAELLQSIRIPCRLFYETMKSERADIPKPAPCMKRAIPNC